jgi:diphthine synthase
LSTDLISLRGLTIAKGSKYVFIDMYTSKLIDDSYRLAELLGREPIKLSRVDLEEKSYDRLLKYLNDGNVCLLVPGNPLIATTHVSLIIEASKRGFEFEIIPAPGILPNALTMSGLMIYKLGKIVTLTYPKNGIVSEYPYDVIKDNDRRNLHTVLLLEYDGERGIEMNISEAIDLLLLLEKRRKENVITPGRLAVAVSSLGSSKARICPGKLEELKSMDIREGPHTLIITSPKLHFMEEEALEVVKNEFCR